MELVPPSEREQLAALVEQWNENRLDLFHLSHPTEDLEIEGVMRFYFQDGGERVLTKCVRVSSTATTRAVVEALAEKFLPDLKMLSDDTYSLWEVHESGGERRLDDEEKPLLVQLTWHRDDREGRFLLRKNQSSAAPLPTIQLSNEEDIKRNTKRFSKREKKEMKKKHQKDIITVNCGREEATGPITDLYCQVPPNSFTRTISNPEVVMKKRREKKLETRLKEMGHGGSLKIYGGELIPSRPYVTILVSMRDRADKILAEALEKYAIDPSNALDYVLVELPALQNSHSLSDLRNISSDGRILEPDEAPLMQMASRGHDYPETYLTLRRKPSGYRGSRIYTQDSNARSLPQVPLNSMLSLMKNPQLHFLALDGSLTNPPRSLSLHGGVTEVGCDRALSQFSAQNICLDGPDMRGRHCVITYMDGVVTITPSAADAIIEVNNRRIGQTEILRDGDLLRIGQANLFRFVSNCKQRAVEAHRQSDYSTLSHAMNAVSLSGPCTVSQVQSDPGEPGMSASTVQTLAPIGSTQALNTVGAMPFGTGATLPVTLQIGDYKVWDYLVEVMSRGWTDAGQFRLSPAYSLYLALRFFQSHSKPYLVQFFTRIAHHMTQISQECTSRDELLFWLANASELSFLVDRDPDLKTPRSGQLGTVVETVFRRLCTVLLGAIRPACKPMLDVSIPIEDGSNDLLTLLDGTLRAARSARLNAALTIQLCSHVLHAINAMLFNSLVGVASSSAQLTTRRGKFLQARLAAIHGWAEQMGVELAAECHLDRSRQAAALLAAQKNDVAALGATCYKLNSLQVHYLLTHFSAQDGEIPCDNDVITRIVGLSERQADALTAQDGHPVTLAESEQLLLPFLLPQDGYTAEQLKGVPDGLVQYLLSLQEKGLCHSVCVQESASSMWKTTPPIQRPPPVPPAQQPSPPASSKLPITKTSSQTTLTSLPTGLFGDSCGGMGEDIIRVVLKRGGGGIGLSIVAAQLLSQGLLLSTHTISLVEENSFSKYKGVGDRQVGIYVKKVVPGSPAAQDGRLAAGDQLLSVNGQSLLGISQEEAAEYMARAGSEVRFDVRKRAALRNGLSAWLCQPSTPTVQAGAVQHQQTSFPPGQQSGPLPNFNTNYSNYAALPSYGSQMSVQMTNGYQKHQPAPIIRTSAFAPVSSTAIEANRHFRSVSASDLYQSDPNASYSQRSITGSTTGVSGFDRLPAHYRHSNRPTVFQPGRPSASSPSALRKGAQSPSSIYRPPSTTNLFAPPRSPNPLQQQGYSSAALRESNHDIHKASQPASPPAAHSSPREEHRVPISMANVPSIITNHSASLPTPLNRSSYTIPSYNQSHVRNIPIVRYSPREQTSPSHSLPNGSAGGLVKVPTYMSSSTARSPEATVVRPVELTGSEVNGDPARVRGESRSTTTTFGVMAPTAFTQAMKAAGRQEQHVVLASPRTSVMDRELWNLERTNTALMSREAVNEELDRLDAKGINMTEEETRRYRELLNIATEQSRRSDVRTAAVVAPTSAASYGSTETQRISAANRTETLIDDIDGSSGRSAMRENISPGESYERKIVQFKEMKQTELLDSPSIYGTNEIYRDPRQQRLNELQERQETQSRVPDALGFRDKMRIFATQLGEGTPKSRYSASSAERQIQND